MQQANQSEVARLLAQIQDEHEAAVRGMYAFKDGASKHAFIAARMENMQGCVDELALLVGEQAAWEAAVQRLG